MNKNFNFSKATAAIVFGICSLGTLTSLTEKAIAQSDPGCYMINSSQQTVDLTSICGSSFSSVPNNANESVNSRETENSTESKDSLDNNPNSIPLNSHRSPYSYSSPESVELPESWKFRRNRGRYARPWKRQRVRDRYFRRTDGTTQQELN
ncbi:MAG: hypothetical protein QNJ54_28740 [Prochloraceae cyanobacterium]|nr:hypothetical protein [Prochloraceae cyanobacterium]